MQSAQVSPDHPRIIAFPPVLVAVPFLIGLALSFLRPVSFLLEIRLVGAALVVSGVMLLRAALQSMREAGTRANPYMPTVTIIRSGPYGVTRNPMYLALGCIYLGLALAFSLWGAVALIPIPALLIHYGVVRQEEEYLRTKFGQSYADYARTVRRWI